MRVLVDTSVWSLSLRRGHGPQNPEADELRRLIAAHVVEIIGPIRQEILSGVRDPAQSARLEGHLAAFPDLPLLTEDYVTAAKFFNLCRSKGIQGSNTDFLICAVAVRHDLAIFTTDGDFPRFARCLPIVLHEIRGTCEPRYRRSAPKREA
jgi:predicted nucleic acid-binding protein